MYSVFFHRFAFDASILHFDGVWVVHYTTNHRRNAIRNELRNMLRMPLNYKLRSECLHLTRDCEFSFSVRNAKQMTSLDFWFEEIEMPKVRQHSLFEESRDGRKREGESTVGNNREENLNLHAFVIIIDITETIVSTVFWSCIRCQLINICVTHQHRAWVCRVFASANKVTKKRYTFSVFFFWNQIVIRTVVFHWHWPRIAASGQWTKWLLLALRCDDTMTLRVVLIVNTVVVA